MTSVDISRDSPPTARQLDEALRDLASSQRELVGALTRIAGPVTTQVQQVGAIMQLLQRRLQTFDPPSSAGHPGLRARVPGRDPCRDEAILTVLRQAEAALRVTERRVELDDGEHPTITELARLQTELVSASLAPLVHVLISLIEDTARLEAAIEQRGAAAGT